MVGRIALRPLLRVLRGARQNGKWAELKVLLKDRLFARRKPPKSQDPNPPLLFQMATGYWLSQAIYVAAKLGIADFLENGPKSSTELAAATGCDPSSLFRVLRALASAGVLSQIDGDRFALTRLGGGLRGAVPGSQRSIVITIGEIHYQACGDLLHAVRTGSPAFNRVFGASLFEHLAQNPQDGAAFNQGMTDMSSMVAYAILLAYDFSEISSVVDVGGGEGQLLRRILHWYPEMNRTIFDYSSALRSPASFKEDRCSFIAGSFFDSVPAGAEAYLLCSVLHDWSDELAGAILRNCRKAMANNARLLVVETVVPETSVSSFSKLLDINMMAMSSGRERTKSEFQALLNAAGFKLTRIIRTLAPQSIIEARPK
jgi:O-methyltransferase domain/Dimerisation domain